VLEVLHLLVPCKVSGEELDVHLVLLRSIVYIVILCEGFERGWVFELFFYIVIIDFDDGGGHIVEGFIQLNEFHLFFLALFNLFSELVQFLSRLGVAFN
jgi:hypothetical protein